MANGSLKFVQRHPRYTLDADDDRFMLYAVEGSTIEHSAEILNISASGLGFVIEEDLAPQYGQMIKVEFNIPDFKKVAWWGRVVRIYEFTSAKWWKNDEPEEGLVFVGVHFNELPLGHQDAIEQGLRKKFVQILDRRKKERFIRIKKFLSTHKSQIIMYSALVLFTFCLLYFASLPTTTYDKNRGTQWGKRFEIFNFTKSK